MNVLPETVLLTDFKAHDKRFLMEMFFSDPRVVSILAGVFKGNNFPSLGEPFRPKQETSFNLIKQAQSQKNEHGARSIK